MDDRACAEAVTGRVTLTPPAPELLLFSELRGPAPAPAPRPVARPAARPAMSVWLSGLCYGGLRGGRDRRTSSGVCGATCQEQR